MSVRFDHALWVVSDLGATAGAFAGIGFHLSEQGEHPGRGTRNRCIHFGLSYIELIHAADEEAVASASDAIGARLVDVQRAGGGLYTFALATPSVADAARGLQRAGYDVDEPHPGSRRRPDGSIVRWSSLGLPQAPAGPTPFLIEWELNDRQRLAYLKDVDFIGPHRLGELRLDHVGIAIEDLAAEAAYYRDVLRAAGSSAAEDSSAAGGAAFEERAGEDPELGARYLEFRLAVGAVRLLEPAGSGPVRSRLDSRGPGPLVVCLVTGEPDRVLREVEADPGSSLVQVDGAGDGLLRFVAG